MDTSLFLDERKTSFSDNEMTVKWMDGFALWSIAFTNLFLKIEYLCGVPKRSRLHLFMNLWWR